MKINIFILTIIFSMCTVNSAFSAQVITHDTDKDKIGVVSASGATTLDDLVTMLSEKADKQGASYFKVVSTTGKNKLHGVAETYK